jgi:glycosyltransferase involved in cell wall biosynthesis
MIVKGLRDNGVEVVECHTRHPSKLGRFLILSYKFLRVRRVNLILVSENGQIYTPLAKLLGLFTGKPVILDAFLSHYHVGVIETGTVPVGSLKARFLHLIDSVACRIADKVLLDTEEHAEYFSREFNIDRSRFESIPIGADDEWFYPRPCQTDSPGEQTRGGLSVLWVGTFYPLQGIQHVLEAANLLREHTDIRFDFYGAGPLRAEMEERAKRDHLTNVRFHGWISPESVPAVMSRADVCLGQFGQTVQAKMVIACKVYEALAMGKPLLTGNSPSMEKFLRHREHVYVCRAGEPKAIAEAILDLRNDPALRQRIGENGLRWFRETASRYKIGAHVKAVCEMLLEARARG